MKRLHLATAIGITLVLLTGCAAGAESTEAPYAPVIDPADFVAVVDNPFFPLSNYSALV